MASLKDQLDQAGYDTSTLDEAAVLKQLSDAGYDVSSFSTAPQGVMGAVGETLKNTLLKPQEAMVNAAKEANTAAGNKVEAGIAGLSDLATGKDISQAADTVGNVEQGNAPTTTSGKVGKVIGSFFTPTQIGLAAGGEMAAKPILNGLTAGANKLGALLAPASDTALPGAAKAAGNLLSTVSGVGTPELETVMANPEAVAAAPSFPEAAQYMAGSMEKLSDHLDALQKTAEAALDSSKELNVSTITDALQTEINNLKNAEVVTPAMEKAQEVLENSLAKLKDKATMTEPQMVKWVKAAQSKVNFNDPASTDLSQALRNVQSTVNDAIKAQNPAYDEAMENYANGIELKNNLSKTLGLNSEGGEFTPANMTVGKMKGLLNPDNALQTKQMLNQFAEVPGVPNYLDIAKQAAAKAALQQGWRSRLAGVLAGLVPGAGETASNAVSGAVKYAPVAANPIIQGLTQ